jgi:putative ABC transport system ATP-binding protein
MLSLQHISKIYIQGNNKIYALNDITMDILEGESLSIIGKSGSGKSTLLHIIGGMDSASSGNILFYGEDLTRQSSEDISKYRRRNVGFVFQFFNLIPELNVLENITFPVLLNKQRVDNDLLTHMITVLGLKKRISHLPDQLSGGEQQRVAIARSIIAKPKILLLDEPTGNLDRDSAAEVLTMLKSIKSEHLMSVVTVTHDMDVASDADRIIKLSGGEIMK